MTAMRRQTPRVGPAAVGRGVVCAGDILTVTTDRKWLSFMRSYPNLIPLSARIVQHIGAAVKPFEFESTLAAILFAPGREARAQSCSAGGECRSVRPVFVAFRPPFKCRLQIGRAEYNVSAIKLAAHCRLAVQLAGPPAGLGLASESHMVVAEDELHCLQPIRCDLIAHLAGLGG
jgi:hypothetical protein